MSNEERVILLVDLIIVIDNRPSRKNEAQPLSKAAASDITSFID